MASYTTLGGGTQEVQVLSPTLTLDVQVQPFVTQPSGVFAQFPIPYVDFIAQGVGQWLGPLADAIEGLIANTAAVDATFAQDVDASGLITDYLDFIVEYTPPGRFGPPMQTTARVTMGSLISSSDPFFSRLGGSPESIIGEAYQALVAASEL